MSTRRRMRTVSYTHLSKTPELAESFGDDNPLAESASYAIYCKDLERQSTLVKYLKNVKGIRRIKEADEIEEGFSSVNKLVGGVSLVLIVVLDVYKRQV